MSEAISMWRVTRSDTEHSDLWASESDAKHYIDCLGHAVRRERHTFDVTLPTGQHITAIAMKR
jgi:hypothetical protein